MLVPRCQAQEQDGDPEHLTSAQTFRQPMQAGYLLPGGNRQVLWETYSGYSRCHYCQEQLPDAQEPHPSQHHDGPALCANLHFPLPPQWAAIGCSGQNSHFCQAVNVSYLNLQRRTLSCPRLYTQCILPRQSFRPAGSEIQTLHHVAFNLPLQRLVEGYLVAASFWFCNDILSGQSSWSPLTTINTSPPPNQSDCRRHLISWPRLL